MANEERNTVVVEKDRSSNPVGWIIGVIVILILLALFFTSGGFGLFSGATAPSADGVNVQPSGQ